MERDPVFARVLGVFGAYGFRKTSMGELAEAMNVSRQTLYNRFEDKQSVLAWAVDGFSRDSQTLALAALRDASDPIQTRILNFFTEWIGVVAPLFHASSHGMEIMEMGAATRQQSGVDPHEACVAALVAMLIDEGECVSEDEASDRAFVLLMASKGLLLKSPTTEDYATGMARVIGAMLRGGALVTADRRSA